MSHDPFPGRSKKDLADMARRHGVSGWHAMTKEQLVKALIRKKAERARKRAAAVAAAAAPVKPKAKAAPPPVAAKAVKAAARDTSNGVASPEEEVERAKFDVGVPTKDLSARIPRNLPTGYGKDRITVMVRDPYWLHVYWELTHGSIQRAEAALGQDWHGSRPILRVFDVSAHDTTSTSEAVLRDIDIHGGCNNWYIEVQQPPKSYRIDVGYLSRRGQFYVLTRSNVVTTPRANVSDTIDENWSDIDAKSADRLFAMSSGFDPQQVMAGGSAELRQLLEEKLRRPLSSPALSSFGSGGLGVGGERKRGFWFQLDAELIVYGATEPSARVTLQGEPIKLRPDGTLTMRFSLPDSRQIIPAVATSADGVEERTIVLAVERNTKHLEPMIHDVNGESA
jgi:uncharacterized protein